MKLYVKLEDIKKLFEKAADEKRNYLFEYEVYELIRLTGGETPLKYHFFDREGRIDNEIISSIPGEKVVIKIVSPFIVHKSDAGGVRVVNKTRTDILSAVRSMMYEIPEKQSAIFLKNITKSLSPNYNDKDYNQNFSQDKSRFELPEHYQNLDYESLVKAIHNDIKGFIICEFLPSDGSEFGNELLVSLRRTREFGMILTAGLGGTNTELYAQRFRAGEAVVSASTEMTDADAFFSLYKKTISFDKLTGVGRGEKRKVTDEQLKECFAAMIKLANHFSPLNPDAPYIIEELEINPFAFYRYLMVPLDGLCRFSTPEPLPYLRPLSKIDKLLHPQSIAIIGVSAKSLNPGRIIVKNIIANGFDKDNLFIIHQGAGASNNSSIKEVKNKINEDVKTAERDISLEYSIKIEGILPIASISELKSKKGKVDLLILAVGASMVEELIDEIIKTDAAESVIMISGGVGEVSGSEEKALSIEKKIKSACISLPYNDLNDSKNNLLNQEGKSCVKNFRPVFLGGNSLGVLSNPGKYDSLFIPEDKLPKSRGNYTRHTAFISQSGAYMITRMSKLSFMDPAYAISIGNQIDLTAGDLMRYFNSTPEIKTIASYMEGFRDLDGLEFAKAVKEAVRKGKDVLFYKAGRTAEGKSATSGHTASLAGDYTVCKSCIKESGAMVANTFTEFEGLLRLSCSLKNKIIKGGRLAAISNAGYESVGIADNILGEDFKLDMAGFSLKTEKNIQETLKKNGLNTLVDIKNPMDVTPMAGEDVYESIIEALLNDPHVDAVAAAIVPLTPVIETLLKIEKISDDLENTNEEVNISGRKNIVHRLIELASKHTKPIVMVVDSGELYDPLAKALQNQGLAVFRSADQAVYVLGKYIQGRLRANKIMGLE